MRKKIIISLLAIISSCVIQAQEFKSEKGPSFEKDFKTSDYHLVFPSAYGVSAYYYLPVEVSRVGFSSSLVIEKFDQGLKKLSTDKFELPVLDNRGAELEKIIELNNQLIVFSRVSSKKSEKHELYAQIYHSETNKMDDAKTIASFNIDSYYKSGFYQVAVSPNKSHIAVLANMPFEKKENEKVAVYVFDTNLNLLWEQKATLNYDSERAYDEDLFVDNYGKVFLQKKLEMHKKSRSIQLITFDGNAVNDKQFSQDGFYPLNTKLIDLNGQSELAGFYWTGNKPVVQTNVAEGDDNSGVYLYSIDQEKILGKHEWSNEVEAKALTNMEVVDIITKDNKIYLFGERQLKKADMSANGNSMSTDYIYNYSYGKSIIAVMDSQGTLDKFTPLFNEKTFKNESKENASYIPLLIDNNLYTLSNTERRRGMEMQRYYTDEGVNISYPKLMIQATPQILPNSVARVTDYNILYYIIHQSNKYYLAKTTW